MSTFFDFLTVACFLATVMAFFQFTDRQFPTLLRLIASGIGLAIANQAGNAGWTASALTIVGVSAAYAIFVVRNDRTTGA
jgi:hypothetical protein